MVDEGRTNTRDVFKNITEREGKVFQHREMLQIDYVPDEARIVGRDDQIEDVAEEIAPLVSGKPPNSLLIYGKTGCGKSLVAKHVSQIAHEEAQARGTRLATGYVNCQQASGNTDALSQYGSLVAPAESDIEFPSRGISENEYFERLWTVFDRYYDAALIVLDEVDKLRNDELLMAFSRAGETGSVNVPIGVIAVSNKINFRDQLSERTKSSYGHNEYVFEPYDAAEIREILYNRADAFVDGVLEDGVIPRAAALSAQEHGDARKAIRLLRYAGDQAAREGAATVTEAHLNDARASAQRDRLQELISGLPPHSKYLLVALATLDTNEPDQEWFRTVDVRQVYEDVCHQNGSKVLSTERTRQLLEELSFLEVADSRRGVGDGKGRYNQYSLLWDAEIVETLEV